MRWFHNSDLRTLFTRLRQVNVNFDGRCFVALSEHFWFFWWHLFYQLSSWHLLGWRWFSILALIWYIFLHRGVWVDNWNLNLDIIFWLFVKSSLFPLPISKRAIVVTSNLLKRFQGVLGAFYKFRSFIYLCLFVDFFVGLVWSLRSLGLLSLLPFSLEGWVPPESVVGILALSIDLCLETLLIGLDECVQ